MEERLFSLDLQLVQETVLLAISVFVLFLIMSYNFFEPVRKVLKDRQERIKKEQEAAKKDSQDAADLKAVYDEKLKAVDKEAEEILRAARKTAQKNEALIIQEAKEEAARIIARANNEIALEREKAADDMKQEMVVLASMLAGKVVSSSIDTKVQNELIEETLKEMGDHTWAN